MWEREGEAGASSCWQGNLKFPAKTMMINRLKPARHEFALPTGCPLAWWSHAWRGWRTGWCLRRVRPSRPQRPPAIKQTNQNWNTGFHNAFVLLNLPGGHRWRRSGTWDQFWSLGQSPWPTSGRAACGWATRSTSGNAWFLGGRRFRACNDGASWRLRSRAPISCKPN